MSRNVGDTVRIIPKSSMRSFEQTTTGWQSPLGLSIVTGMLAYCGMEATITRIYYESHELYQIDADERRYIWDESCFEDIEDIMDFDGLEALL